MVRTLPATLGDVDLVSRNDGVDSEANVARLADRGRWATLALLDRPGDAAADLQQSDVRGVEVKGTAPDGQRMRG